MNTSLANKVGVVTGAGRGIGRAIAIAAAAEGAAVVVNDPGVLLDGGPGTERPADEVASSIRAAGGRAVPNTESVASWAGGRHIVDQAISEFGRIDFVVHSAGVLRDAMFHKMSEDDWTTVIQVHLTGGFSIARAAAEHFRRQESGAVVMMTSTSGLIGNLGQANYAAAKLGIVGLIRSIALDMQRFGVRANAIAPFAWTRMTSSIPEPAGEVGRSRASLTKTTPEQVAPLAVFLVSDGAARVTGQVFAVRGAEIVLFSLPRPIRSIHRQGGWTPATLAATLPALESSMTPPQTTADIFSYEPLV